MNAKKLGVLLFLVVVMILGLVACEMSAPATTPATDPATTPQPTTPPVTKHDVIFMDGAVEMFTEQVASGETVAEPDMSALIEFGLDFKAWCTDATLTTEFDFSTPITKTTLLFAKYDFVEYEIEFDLGEYAGAEDLVNPNTKTTFTIADVVNLKPAYTKTMQCVWLDENNNEVTSTGMFLRNVKLTAKWSKRPYISLDFEDAIIHYAEHKGTDIALDGTYQIYKNQTGKLSNPNIYIMSSYKVDEATGYIMLDFGVPTLMEAMKNTHNPMYIKNDGDAYGNYFCIILDHDLTDGSQNETYYFDKNGNKLDHAVLDKDNNTYLYPGVYYNGPYNEHYNVSALCYLQNNNVTEDTVKLSFDFYFEEGGAFPISFYMRAGGKRTNLAALMSNGDISIGVDTVKNNGRLTYVGADGNYITSEQVLGTAVAGEWNHIEFVMTKNEAGTNYAVQILLNGDDLTETTGALNLYAEGMTWGSTSSMFMIFGGGPSVAVNALSKDLVYKFDNIVLEGVEAE